MLAFFLRIAINAIALLAIGRLSGGAIVIGSFGTALIVAAVLGVANATVKPVLLSIAKGMTRALSCLTLGLWSLALSFLMNGLMFWGAAQWFDGFRIYHNSFWTACWGALVLSCVNALATVFTRRDDDEQR